MKYAGPYYARLHNLSKAHSNMNLLCMSLERWERGVRMRKEPAGSFDWHIMYDPEVSYDQAVFDEIEAIFLDFNKAAKSNLSSKRNVAIGNYIIKRSKVVSPKKRPKHMRRTGRRSTMSTVTSASWCVLM